MTRIFKNRILALLLSAVLLFGNLPAMAVAAGTDSEMHTHLQQENGNHILCEEEPAQPQLQQEIPQIPHQSVPDSTGLHATWSNPLYKDDAKSLQVSSQVAAVSSDDPVFYDGILSAGVALRAEMVNRKELVTLGCIVPAEDFDKNNPYLISDQIVAEAFAHTGVPNEGDYLRYHTSGYTVFVQYGTLENDESSLAVVYTYHFTWFTNAGQELLVNGAVADLLQDLYLNGSDYKNIAAIYNWICKVIRYDHNYYEDQYQQNQINLLKHSAYSALIERLTVCQGYASLLYRLALELGIDCRIISGISFDDNHAWNIVQLDGQYYNMDVTWDAVNRVYGLPYEYFLRGDTNFPDHERDTDYLTEAFLSAYPIAAADYVPVEDNYVSGDFVYQIHSGEATLISYTGNDREVVIPETVDGFPITIIGNLAFSHNPMIEKITFSASVLRIEDGSCDSVPEPVQYGAFSHCIKLKSIVFPEDSRLSYIGNFAFCGADALTSVTLPDSIRTLGLSCFDECSALESIYLPEGLE